jgi:Zinc carboxypeptidase
VQGRSASSAGERVWPTRVSKRLPVLWTRAFLWNRSACALILFCFLTTAAFAAVPTPESHFGHPIGADRQLLDWDKVVSYFYALSRSSDKIRVAEYGRSAENRPLIVATIAAPETLRKLDRYREIQRRLADPRITSPAEAEAMFREGKNIVLMTCSIHANEVASTHSAVEFAYRLITENNPRFQTILDNTILLLVPSLNPDGVDIVTHWYRSTLGTKFEGTNPPELYHKYVGHDNNRDWYIFSQPETRATISQLHNIWHPEIVYDVHQQGAYASRMFIPPWLDPAEPNVDPILLQEMNAVGASMAADLTAAGKPGIAIHAAYDFWSPSRHYQAFHGGLRILTESASALLATPLTVAPDQIDENALGYKPREKSWNYIEPWLGGVWKLRDIIDYQELAFESLLHNAAVNREDMLRKFYEVGVHQVARTSPTAIVIPKDQRDPGATRRMLQTLRQGDSHAAAVFGIREGAAGAAAVSKSAAVSRRSAAAALRRYRAHAATAVRGGCEVRGPWGDRGGAGSGAARSATKRLLYGIGHRRVAGGEPMVVRWCGGLAERCRRFREDVQARFP